MLGSPILAHATADEMPPPLTALRLLTRWEFEPVPALAVAVVGVLYLWGVQRLRARGDRWPLWRTASFLGLGLGSAAVATQSALEAYDTVLISVHMVQHMVLSMITPVFLALGAPLALALRTLPGRGRRILTAVIHSRLAAVLTFPVVAGVIFVANPFALYFTGWYEATLRNGYLHDMNHLHFVLVGCLWFWPILGLDPMPRRLAYPMRMIAVFATMPFHAWLGIAIMSASTVMAADWYESLPRLWGPSVAEDQQIAGGILWANGDIVALILLAILFVQWARESEREAAREDRRLDRLERLGTEQTP